MKTKFKHLSLLPIAVCAAVLAFAPTTAHAQNAGRQSFQLTNILATATDITSYPTNSSGTNGAGFLTGNAIDVRDYGSGEVGIFVTFTNSIGGVTNIGNSSSNYLQLTLTRASAAGGTPLNTEFETSPTNSFKIPVNGTTRVNAFIPLDRNWLGPATHVGIYIGTNTCSSGALGSLAAYLTKKASVVRGP